MEEFAEQEYRRPDQFDVILIASDQSQRVLSPQNTQVFTFLDDPDGINYCLEYTPDSSGDSKKEYIFPNDDHIFEVLTALGFRSISQFFANEDQIIEYHSPGNTSSQLNWDVIDAEEGLSIYLNHFTEYSPDDGLAGLTDKDGVTIETETYMLEEFERDFGYEREYTIAHFKLSDEDGNLITQIDFDQRITAVYLITKDAEMSHIFQGGVGYFFGEYWTAKKLIELGFNVITSKYATDQDIYAYETYLLNIAEQQAFEFFNIPPFSEDTDTLQ